MEENACNAAAINTNCIIRTPRDRNFLELLIPPVRASSAAIRDDQACMELEKVWNDVEHNARALLLSLITE